MILALTGLVVLLYIRSLKFHYMPDDKVPRSGYLYNVPNVLPPADFMERIPPKRVRLWCIANHCLNVAFISVLFGWKPALIFAVHPMSVEMVCWLTGNYYAGTTLLVLAAYWAITHLPVFAGIPLGIAFYTAALNSTITALGVPLFFLFTANIPGMSLFVPWVFYFKGKRFRSGLKKRAEVVPNPFDKIELGKLAWMTKHVARYILGMFLFPFKMALFRHFGEHILRSKEEYDEYLSFNKDFWVSLLICLTTFGAGLWINWKATIWFFTMIAPHSQFKIYGQPSPCARYLYLPMVGLCILLAHLPDPILFMFAGFFLYRTHAYIPAWENLETLKKNDLDNFPERAMAHTDYAQHLLQRYVLNNKDILRINQASYHLEMAKRMDPELWTAYLNLALFHNCMGNLKQCLEYTEIAYKLAVKENCNQEILGIVFRQVEGLRKVVKENAGNIASGDRRPVLANA
jgi:hypothetical protein